jgi:dTDP-4-dehydrorhamnose 3,5-epimerase
LNIIKTNLDGVLLIEPDVFYDQRGFFFESYNQKKYNDLGINAKFVQDNISKSSKGTIRGLHYQIGENAQGKLCSVISGRVLDVAIDIQVGSPTFGNFYAVELDGEKKNQLWIPPGFAHGFSVLSDEVIFSYKCTNLYDKSAERAIRFNDPEINIDWQVENPIISEKDLKAPFLIQLTKNDLFTYSKEL